MAARRRRPLRQIDMRKDGVATLAGDRRIPRRLEASTANRVGQERHECGQIRHGAQSHTRFTGEKLDRHDPPIPRQFPPCESHSAKPLAQHARLSGSSGATASSHRRVTSSSFRENSAFRQGEEHDLLAGDGADVVVHADDLDAGDLLDHRLHERSRSFEKMRAHLFEQVSPFLGRQRLDQVLFGGSQNALEADEEECRRSGARGCPWAPGPCIPARSD